ncbi:hypothetical protein P43SY_007016 [Pythium insidiosum]|uniref:Uncharacterized protein n=1 Tax=Pythium insidiosum TaxID=114742 RepID=A0AAD5M867_PYTIN|nr:hypothetical protein P43SY_007016 [Pythium insidiosum]
MGKTKAAAVLNLSRSPDDYSSSSSNSDNESVDKRVQSTAEASGSEDEDDEEDEDEQEFEIPPGFERVSGSSAITRESILKDEKELWLFKLPKHVDASALAGAKFKLSHKTAAAPGAALTSVSHDGKTYQLVTEDAMLTQQLVNAFPTAKDRKQFVLGKPFSRCFSLVVDRSHPAAEEPVTEPVAKKSSKKSKEPVSGDRAASTKATKKSKTKH